MKKLICLLIISIFFSMFCINEVFAYTNVQVNLSSDKSIIKPGEEIEIVLSIENAKTAAFTAYIYFDNSYLEYVKGPKMSNLDNNRIIYVWYDESGIGDSKDGELARFSFKAKKDGGTSLDSNGEFYDEDGDVIQADFKDFEIRIGEELIEYNAVAVKTVNEDVDDTSNTNLETLAVENMLLYPPFDNNITSYNFEVPNDLKDLNILAVPENEKAKAVIQGGKGLKEGDNSIKVTVTAENGKTQKVYSLNAYRRNLEEEQAYLKEQEENKKKLEEIYNTQKTSTEIETIDATEESKEAVLENNETQRNNLWIIVVIAFGIVLVIGIIIFKYKNKKRIVNKKYTSLTYVGLCIFRQIFVILYRTYFVSTFTGV